jgi:DNA-binding NarL/FixJ family response regulator
MIADDHQMVIRGLNDMLRDVAHIHVKGTYTTGKELLAGLQKEQPDVLILDIQMPEMTGDEAAAVIVKQYPSVRILVLTNSDQAFHAQNMLQKGALGYLLKNTDPDTLVKAVETVHSGRQFIDPYMKEATGRHAEQQEGNRRYAHTQPTRTGDTATHRA